MSPQSGLALAIWAPDALAAAFDALAAACGLRRIASPPEMTGAAAPDTFLPWLAKRAGGEAESIQSSGAELAANLKRRGACLLICEGGYLALVRVRGSKAFLAVPGGKIRRVSLGAVCGAVWEPVEREDRLKLNVMAKAAGISRVSGAGIAIPGERRFLAGWSLGPGPARTIREFLAASGTWGNAAVLFTAHLSQYVLWLLSWWILGQLSFSGHLDRGWLLAWSLLLLTIVPMRILETYAQGILAIAAGAALKRHLLQGALRLPVDQLRQLGPGGVLSQIFEAEAVETLALSGGVAGCLALIELVAAGAVLGWLALPLAGFVMVIGLLGRQFWRRYQTWTGTRLMLTENLVEAMVGQRTRLAQQRVEHWHTGEDALLDRYHEDSRGIDWLGGWLIAVAPRGWLIAGLVCLAPSAISETADGATLALRLGGVLLAWTAFQKLTGAAVELAGTMVAAVRIAPLLKAVRNQELVGAQAPDSHWRDNRRTAPGAKVIEADRLQFRYPSSQKVALQSASLGVRTGDRILVEGTSGGGKSTLSAVLSGLREPTSGVLLAGGLDRFTLGEAGWRHRVAPASQFHDNHILTETLAFNLLLGRSWPPRAADVTEAEELCRELGLGALIDRMPAGMAQMLGEGGWQLSQGERSRVFLARAILQHADLTILDESFGALDPENLKAAMECTLARTNALMVIAHP